MADDFEKELERLIFSTFKQISNKTMVGFEKESLRIEGTAISQKRHPINLGSALFNPYITTDFSEAQLEFVTPPFENKADSMTFLEDIHHFATTNLNGEIIWPLSMPIYIDSSEEIPIAEYGKSNFAKFKKIYRKGLSYRYGNLMQAISGFHFNYSIPQSFWDIDLKDHTKSKMNKSKLRSRLYFNLIRNIYRHNALIIYLFGASPMASENFISSNSSSFKKLDSQTLYLPHATSLRMSKHGYKNKRRKKLQVSLNSLDEYIEDLRKATATRNDDYMSYKEEKHAQYLQLNENYLQIDDEYYAIARAKSELISDLRTTSKLKSGGVDFIEYRSLDLNPFSRIGIDEQSVMFLEILFAYCFIKQNGDISREELDMIDHNDELVAIEGRRKTLKINHRDKKISFNQWCNQVIEKLFPIAEILNHNGKDFTAVLEKVKLEINNPDDTLSAKLLEEISSRRESFLEFGLNIGDSNKRYYLDKEISSNKNWPILQAESKASLIKQSESDNLSQESFENYLKNYFSK